MAHLGTTSIPESRCLQTHLKDDSEVYYQLLHLSSAQYVADVEQEDLNNTDF